jgi:hypothetical protein
MWHIFDYVTWWIMWLVCNVIMWSCVLEHVIGDFSILEIMLLRRWAIDDDLIKEWDMLEYVMIDFMIIFTWYYYSRRMSMYICDNWNPWMLFCSYILICGILSNPQWSFGWPPRHLYKWCRRRASLSYIACECSRIILDLALYLLLGV